jgi:hypothetical protein
LELSTASNDPEYFAMPLKARRPVAGESVDRITLNLAAEDKAALEKIADEKKVSIAWVIRDAITRYLTEQPQKIRGVPPQMSYPLN